MRFVSIVVPTVLSLIGVQLGRVPATKDLPVEHTRVTVTDGIGDHEEDLPKCFWTDSCHEADWATKNPAHAEDRTAPGWQPEKELVQGDTEENLPDCYWTRSCAPGGWVPNHQYIVPSRRPPPPPPPPARRFHGPYSPEFEYPEDKWQGRPPGYDPYRDPYRGPY